MLQMTPSYKRPATSPASNIPTLKLKPAQPTDFSKLNLGSDYFQVNNGGVVQNVLAADLPKFGLAAESPLQGNLSGQAATLHVQRSTRTPVKSVTPGKSPSTPTNKASVTIVPQSMESMYNTFTQKFSKVNAKFHSEKSGVIPALASVAHQLSDSETGLDAVNLRLDALESDVIHPNGFRASFDNIRAEIENVKADQVSVSINGDAGEVHLQKLSELKDHGARMEKKMELMANTVHLQQQQIQSLKHSVTSLVAVHLSANLFLGGIREQPGENCKDLAMEFFSTRMGLAPESRDIILPTDLGKMLAGGSMEHPLLCQDR